MRVNHMATEETTGALVEATEGVMEGVMEEDTEETTGALEADMEGG